MNAWQTLWRTCTFIFIYHCGNPSALHSQTVVWVRSTGDSCYLTLHNLSEVFGALGEKHTLEHMEKHTNALELCKLTHTLLQRRMCSLSTYILRYLCLLKE